MISPLPRNKRAKNPYAVEGGPAPAAAQIFNCRAAARRQGSRRVRAGRAAAGRFCEQSVRPARSEVILWRRLPACRVRPTIWKKSPAASRRQPTGKMPVPLPATNISFGVQFHFKPAGSLGRNSNRARIPAAGNRSRRHSSDAQKSRTICIKPCCFRRAPQRAPAGRAEQPLPRQFQNRVVLPRRPAKITPLNFELKRCVFAFHRRPPTAMAKSHSPPDPSSAPRPATVAVLPAAPI